MGYIPLHGDISLLAIGGHHHIDTDLVYALGALSTASNQMNEIRPYLECT